MRGQATVAGGALADALREGTYLKVVCERSDKRTALERPPAATADMPSD
jgi:hypothetical protein